jgi:hypothetical protein
MPSATPSQQRPIRFHAQMAARMKIEVSGDRGLAAALPPGVHLVMH